MAKSTKTYHASIKVMGKLYTAEGATLAQAITGLKPDGLARGVTVLAVRHGDKTEERILPKIATVRLFAPSQLIRERALTHVIERFTL